MAVVFLLHAADGAMLPSIFKALEEGTEGEQSPEIDTDGTVFKGRSNGKGLFEELLSFLFKGFFKGNNRER